MSERTRYSEKLPGDPGNYRWEVRVDVTGGYVGINQVNDTETARVLLSPEQWDAVKRFVASCNRADGRTAEPAR